MNSTMATFGRIGLSRHCGVSWVLEHCVVAFIGFTAQAKPARFEGARTPAPYTLPFVFNPGDATDTQGIGF